MMMTQHQTIILVVYVLEFSLTEQAPCGTTCHSITVLTKKERDWMKIDDQEGEDGEIGGNGVEEQKQ